MSGVVTAGPEDGGAGDVTRLTFQTRVGKRTWRGLKRWLPSARTEVVTPEKPWLPWVTWTG